MSLPFIRPVLDPSRPGAVDDKGDPTDLAKRDDLGKSEVPAKEKDGTSSGKPATAQKKVAAEAKVFNTQMDIGKAKYVVNFHDGKKTHEDGSPFYDIEIFHNKKDLAEFTERLKQEGYTEER
jgi:hypothetical protein